MLEGLKLAAVRVPIVAEFEKKLVVDALVEKRFVVVAEVPVAFMNVKFCKVEEPAARRFPNVPRPELLCVVENNVVAKKFVVVA